MVSTVVWRNRKSTGKISDLQKLEPASPRGPSSGGYSMNCKFALSINEDRLQSEIDELATFSEAGPPAVTRIVFTDTDLKARAWMKARCEEAGLRVRYDAIGNTFARWNGADPAAPRVGS